MAGSRCFMVGSVGSCKFNNFTLQKVCLGTPIMSWKPVMRLYRSLPNTTPNLNLSNVQEKVEQQTQER